MFGNEFHTLSQLDGIVFQLNSAKLVYCRLMLYGVVCTLAERNEAAETFFEAATNVDAKSIMAWTMLGK